jgi:hypothetical protein
LFVAAAIISLIVGYAIGSDGSVARYPKMQDWNGSHAQAEDAMRRWAPKAGLSLQQVRQGYNARLMAFPTKNCIQLEIGPIYDVGGEPIYCYRANSLDLVEEYSDVE